MNVFVARVSSPFSVVRCTLIELHALWLWAKKRRKTCEVDAGGSFQ